MQDTIFHEPYAGKLLRMDLADRFLQTRRWTESLASPLDVEDQVIQSMPDASPTRWHLAHTTWFFETFLLAKFQPDYASTYPQFEYLFNSYYNTIGQQFPRSKRGLISRPTVSQVNDYRHDIDQRIADLLDQNDLASDVSRLVEIGIQHEQQHQELILTDIKHVLGCNPLDPIYHSDCALPESGLQQESIATNRAESSWLQFDAGTYQIGSTGDGFAFDNEHPRHSVLLNPFRLATRLVTNQDFLEFIRDGGYERPEFWLSVGWSWVNESSIRSPMYWDISKDNPTTFTLGGRREVEPHEPVVHVSFFEADAFARWSGCRLPTEFEWEVASADQSVQGNLADSRRFHPATSRELLPGINQAFGDVWEWTSSPYVGYPGYRAPAGAIGEYNGKFMCDQWVLRGGSCATPGSHIRFTYRNFFPASARWQFSGIRLAQDGVQ